MVKSADRVLDIFEALAYNSCAMTHTELSVALGIPKSSLTQLLINLTERKYLTYTAGPNTYALGERLHQLVAQGQSNQSITDLAQALCDRVTRITGESSSLNLPREYTVERVCGANSSHPLTFSMKIGEVAPMYAVSSGKVILAWMPPEQLKNYLQTVSLQAFTPHTQTREQTLRQELERIRQEGLAYSLQEYTPGIIGMAVPVFHAGKVIGAFNIAMPHIRDTPAQRRLLEKTLKEAAVHLEKSLPSVPTEIEMPTRHP